MVVGIVRFEIHIPAAGSLKEKRRVVRAIKDRITERVRAAVAEVDHQDLWQRAAFGIAVVAADGGRVREQLDGVRRIVESHPEAVVIDWQERVE